MIIFSQTASEIAMAPADLFETQKPNFTLYRSGASSISDAVGYMEAEQPIGITATDASVPVLEALSDYASCGGMVFVDSGAFRILKATGGTIDYAAVMNVYRTLVKQTVSPGNLLLVGPDRVGDQVGSLEMLMHWHREVCWLIDQGVEVMIPFQRGESSLTEYWHRVDRLLCRPFVVGLPSNASAIPEPEVLNFMKEVQPERVHFLGCSETALLHKALHSAPSCIISSDATRLRAHLGEGRQLTTRHRCISVEMIQSALRGESEFRGYDETEALGHLDSLLPTLPQNQVARLADRLGLSTQALLSAAEASSTWELIEGACHGYGATVFSSWWATEVSRLVSPAARIESVTQLARQGIL